MKKTLSFWKPVYRGFSWVGKGFKAFWMVAMKFYLSPTEKNLLVSYWYDLQHFRRLKPDKNIDEYLDSRVQTIKRVMTDMDGSARSRQLNGDLLQALKNKRIRAMFVCYLESPSPKEGYRQVAAAIRRAWRLEEVGEGETVGTGEGEMGGTGVNEPGVDEVNEPVVGAANEGEVDEVNEPVVNKANEDGVNAVDEQVKSEKPFLNAKAYVIAAQLDHELTDRDSVFDVMSRDLPELIKFVRERFGVEKLPGTFENFKGYSYKSILNQRSRAKRGQLKVPFRQIRNHPEVFGAAVAARAGEIYDKYLV